MDKKKAKPVKRRESLTPEEQLARAQRAKWRFRAIGRFVMHNLYWLEDVEDQKLGDDVQKNIMLLTRKKEKKSLLSLQDKAILNKPAEFRTEEEKQHLSRIIGGLKCFRRYPSHVKAQLAGVTYFFYFGPDRTIVRQGDESHSLFFIITGEVTVTQESFDPVLNEMSRQDIGVVGPGSMFGEVALLHDVPRTATITSNTHVELLCLKKHDFDVILKATVQQQWNEVHNAMCSFAYFEDWDEMAVRECCILSKMKVYYPDATILGDGCGLRDYVYFIIKGKCRVIEHLLVTTEMRGGKNFYKLYQPTTATEGSAEVEEKSSAFSRDSRKSKTKLMDLDRDDSIEADLTTPIDTKVSSAGSKKAGHVNEKESASVASEKRSDSTELNLITKPKSRPLHIDLPPNVETHFMQVCLLHPTACFGIGENMNNRRIVATTFTECLLIPRYWLMQKNKGNIWNRVQQFLNSHIPTTRQVFKAFVNQRKWLAYRKQLFNDILAKGNVNTNNSITNVPYHIRINDEIDLL